MARPNPMLWPAALWHEARGLKIDKNHMRHNPLYVRHDAHVITFKRTALPLRRYHSKNDHDAHVKVLHKLLGGVLKRNTESVAGGAEDRCVVWTGFVEKDRKVTCFRPTSIYGGKFNAVSVYQRLHEGVYLGKGMMWGLGECRRPDCLKHRMPITYSKANSIAKLNAPNYREQVLRLHANSHNRITMSDAQIEQMREQIREGKPVSHIARDFGVSRWFVYDVRENRRRAKPLTAVKPTCGISFITQQLGA